MLKRAREQHTVKEIREYLELYPEPNRKRAAKIIADLRSEARAQLVDRVPFETRPVVLALVDWLAAHDTETVELVITDPAASDLAAIDASLAPLGSTEAPIAPLAPVFAGGAPDRALRDALDKTLATIFPNGIVTVTKTYEATKGAPFVELAYRVKATGGLYHMGASARQFPGVAADFDFTLRVPGQAPLALHVTGVPGETFAFTTDMFHTALLPQYPSSDAADADIYEAMIAQSYDRLARQLEERLTGKAAQRPRGKTHAEAVLAMCESGDDAACVEAADALVEGKDLPKDLEKALAYYESACMPKRVPHACLRAARLSLMGEGLPHDADRAQSTASFACPEKEEDPTDVDACLFYAQIALRDPEVAPYLPPPGQLLLEGPGFAELAWKRACRAGHAPSCVHVAELADEGWVESNGSKVEPDPDEARAYRDLACRAGDAASCPAKPPKRK